jgi:hypothetical protein
MVHITGTFLKRSAGIFMSVAALAGLVLAPVGTAAAESISSLGAHRVPTLRYVALGDSVAAGLGLPPLPGATSEDTACGRSSQAYFAGAPISDQEMVISFPDLSGVTLESIMDSAPLHGSALGVAADARAI